MVQVADVEAGSQSGMLSGVAIPTPQPNRFTLDELVARGGKLMPPAPTPSAGEPQAPDEDWL